MSIVCQLENMRKLKNEELNRVDVEEFKRLEKIPLIVVLDNIRSMNNIGSVFRTSDSFKIEKIILCGITAQPPQKEIHKTALGATESVDWCYYEQTESAIATLKEEGWEIFAIEQAKNSIMLNDFEWKKSQKIAVVFGHEVKGVSQQVVDACNACIEIPQFGTKHSLNISVCAGVVIWDLFKKWEFSQ